MNLEQLKNRVREAFLKVDSKEFLEHKIYESLKIHEFNYKKWQINKPNSTLAEFKEFCKETVNLYTTDSEEFMTIGIYLIALDQFNP